LERYLKTLTVLLFFTGLSAGCGRAPTAPDAMLTLTAVFPLEGSTAGTTTARLFGSGFREGMRLTVGGVSGVKYTVANPARIDLTMPPHSPGVVDIVLTSLSGEVLRLTGSFTYVDRPPPVVTHLTPARISTQGSSIYIKGTGFSPGTSVRIDGTIASVFFYEDTLYTAAPAHLAGAVDVVVTNLDGQAVRLPRALTFAPPESFDFNGSWEGDADDGSHQGTVIRFTIQDNVMVSLACGAVANLLAVPYPTVTQGQISSMGAGITGRITSDGEAQGSINIAPCINHVWTASKK
jgi:hypothetical protein